MLDEKAKDAVPGRGDYAGLNKSALVLVGATLGGLAMGVATVLLDSCQHRSTHVLSNAIVVVCPVSHGVRCLVTAVQPL